MSEATCRPPGGEHSPVGIVSSGEKLHLRCLPFESLCRCLWLYPRSLQQHVVAGEAVGRTGAV